MTVVLAWVPPTRKCTAISSRPQRAFIRARARSVFDGRVAAVFQLNGLWNILVRHGDYISVYCNLSAALVKPGDAVKARQPVGDVFSDGSDGGRTVLHFQLRREKEKLNPEQWLAL